MRAVETDGGLKIAAAQLVHRDGGRIIAILQRRDIEPGTRQVAAGFVDMNARNRQVRASQSAAPMQLQSVVVIPAPMTSLADRPP